MNHEKNISACRVEVDFACLLWEADCEPRHLHDISERAEAELGKTTIADLVQSLLKTLRGALDGLKTQVPQSVICTVRMAFDQLVSQNTVQTYLLQLESFLNQAFKSTFPDFTGVRVRTRYEYGKDVTVATPWASAGGGRTPFEA